MNPVHYAVQTVLSQCKSGVNELIREITNYACGTLTNAHLPFPQSCDTISVKRASNPRLLFFRASLADLSCPRSKAGKLWIRNFKISGPSVRALYRHVTSTATTKSAQSPSWLNQAYWISTSPKSKHASSDPILQPLSFTWRHTTCQDSLFPLLVCRAQSSTPIWI